MKSPRSQERGETCPTASKAVRFRKSSPRGRPPTSGNLQAFLELFSAVPCGAACSVVIAPLRPRLPCPAGSPVPSDLFRCRRRCSLLDLSPRFGSPRRASPTRPGNGSLLFGLCVPLGARLPLRSPETARGTTPPATRTVFFPRSSSCRLPLPFSPIPPRTSPAPDCLPPLVLRQALFPRT